MFGKWDSYRYPTLCLFLFLFFVVVLLLFFSLLAALLDRGGLAKGEKGTGDGAFSRQSMLPEHYPNEYITS